MIDCILDMWVSCSEYLDHTYTLYFSKQFRFSPQVIAYFCGLCFEWQFGFQRPWKAILLCFTYVLLRGQPENLGKISVSCTGYLGVLPRMWYIFKNSFLQFLPWLSSLEGEKRYLIKVAQLSCRYHLISGREMLPRNYQVGQGVLLIFLNTKEFNVEKLSLCASLLRKKT